MLGGCKWRWRIPCGYYLASTGRRWKCDGPWRLGKSGPLRFLLPTLAGVAKRLYVGLLASQVRALRLFGRCEGPLLAPQSHAAESLIEGVPTAPPGQVAIVPVSLTFIGMRDLLDAGELYAVDANQYRLYAALRVPSLADATGNVYYVLHPETLLGE